MDLAGETLGQFQIIEQVGKGGMAIVYKAYQASLQRHVAIKVLAPKLADDMDLVRRFKREATAAAALHHGNVLTIHDVASEGEIHYIVTEFLEGMTLAELLQQEGALPVERILNIVKQVSSALDYAHSKEFIHRDVKPSNVMVDPARNDHVTLMDFGLVQAPGGSRITKTGFIMGTPDYMSPEQAKGDPVDRRTDIYSLGVTTYHMLTGDVPFSKSTPHAVLLAHIMEDPPSMATSDKEISFEVESVVRKAMNKDPADRYEWAGEMATDLDMAVITPSSFIAPPIRPSMYPQAPPTVPAYGETRPGPPQYGQTPPPGAPAYTQTPPGGVTPYPAATTPIAVQPTRPRWVWPVVGLSTFAVLAVLIILGILFWPRISALVMAVPTPTVTLTPTTSLPTPTPEPKVEVFDVSPREITQGDRVTIDWRVSGVNSVTIHPNVREDAPSSGSMVDQPGGTTSYKLVYEGGESQEIEVTVKERPGAPKIAHFTIDPEQAVRGSTAELSWSVEGRTTRVEISANFQTSPAPAEGRMPIDVDSTTVYVLSACNGELCDTASVTLEVVEPTAVPTNTPEPTATDEPTPTPAPPTATPTEAPPTATSAPRPPTSTPAPVAQPSAGVVHDFEQFGTWKRGDQPYGEFTQSRDQVKSGNYAGKLAYDFSSASAADDFVVFANQKSVAGEPNVITAWVYGDQSGHFVNAWIQDAEGQVWGMNLGSITFNGWQQMSGAIDPTREWPSGKVFGPDNGRIDYPIRFYGIVLDRPGGGPRTGTIYIDDIAFETREAGETPAEGSEPGAVVPVPGQTGRIIYTVKVEEKRYSLYSTDPTWSKGVKIGETDYSHSTCPEGNTVATALDGTQVGLRPISRCQIAGTVGSCPSPDGKWKVNTNNYGSGFSVVLFNVEANRIEQSYHEGKLNIYVGLNWAPDSSHFLFTIDSSVYRADVGKSGIRQVIPYKDPEYPLQFSADGSWVMYLKPVNGAIADVFVNNSNGTNERNVTNAPIAVKLCPRWRD